MDAAFFRAWLAEAGTVIESQRDHLTQLDAAIGDADHGINLARGFSAIAAAMDQAATPTPGSVLILAGSTLISKVGGASGPLYGMALRQAGKSLGDTPTPACPSWPRAWRRRWPACRSSALPARARRRWSTRSPRPSAALHKAISEGASARRAVGSATAAAEGAQATISMHALKGRASYLGPRSVGHEDPGAASTAIIMGALRDVASRQAT